MTTESKGWNWGVVTDDGAKIWLEPAIESYYLLHRWEDQGKKDFLDLGCGLGRHAILFAKNGFNVSCFDISEKAVRETEKWAKAENLKIDYKIGDMLELPYRDESFDCILCRNVISHTDTTGMKKVISEIKRVLRPGGECYLTLCSKDTWFWKRGDWPLIDENTNLRMVEGPEYKVPHFYVDYKLAKELFAEFEIVNIRQEIDYFEDEKGLFDSYHYHLLIRKAIDG